MTSLMKPQFPCRAKDPSVCRYHGAFLRYEAAVAAGDANGVLQARADIESMQKRPTRFEDDTIIPERKTFLDRFRKMEPVKPQPQAPVLDNLLTADEVEARISRQLKGEEPFFTPEELDRITDPGVKRQNFSLAGWVPKSKSQREAVRRVLRELQDQKDAADHAALESKNPTQYNRVLQGKMLAYMTIARKLSKPSNSFNDTRLLSARSPQAGTGYAFYSDLHHEVTMVNLEEIYGFSDKYSRSMSVYDGFLGALEDFRSELQGDMNAASDNPHKAITARKAESDRLQQEYRRKYGRRNF